VGQGKQFRLQDRGIPAGAANDLGNGRLAIQHKTLWQVANTQTGIAGDMAGIGLLLAGDYAQQGRLATAIGTHQTGTVARIYAECNVFE
jgi:hypothetical protein